MSNDPATTQELADELGVSASHLRVAVHRKGPVPGVEKRGNVNLYARAPFFKWWESLK